MTAPYFSPDTSDFLRLLSQHHVRYMVVYIGIAELIRNKAAAGREKDLDDLRFLLKVGGES